MKKTSSNKLAREKLDGRLNDPGIVTRLTRPARGWIRAIRQSLGMTTGQLGRRLGVGQSTVVELETSESMGSIKISSLRKVAEALDCTLVYAFVPNSSLAQMVEDKKRAMALEMLRSVDHTMRLENQAVEDKNARDRNLEMAMDMIDERRLWDDR